MPQVGERINPTLQFAKMYEKDPLAKYAQTFKETMDNILVSERADLISEPGRTMMCEGAIDTLKNFFVENSFDPEEKTLEEQEDFRKDMESLFENDMEVVKEYAAISNFNPVIGMSVPIHKNILMNNVFDKGVITKVVANSSKFTMTMETRYILTPEGEEIDIWKEQNRITQAIDSTAPIKNIPLALPENMTTDILRTYFGRTGRYDALDISTYITAVLVKSCVRAGDKYIEFTPGTPAVIGSDGTVTTPAVPATFKEMVAEADCDSDDMKYVWRRVNAHFTPYYGEYDRTMTYGYNPDVITKLGTTPAEDTTAKVVGVLTGFMKKNRFLIQTTGEAVAVLMAARIDTSTAMLPTCSVHWGHNTTIEEIGTAIPINTAISPEEIKDIPALHGVNQITKIMSMIKLVIGDYKDNKIKEGLDISFLNLPDSCKIARTFDCKPRQGYYSDHFQWRRDTFMETLEDYVDLLFQVLNDPNMTVSVVGRSGLIKKISPNGSNVVSYQTPSSIGPVELDYVKTVVTQNKKVIQFVSTDKMRGNDNLIIILNPRNTDRIVYRIYDYQMFVSNEIRNVELYTLPSIHAFERWKFVEYQGLQGRLKMLNTSGLDSHEPNLDPIGGFAMNDFDITP